MIPVMMANNTANKAFFQRNECVFCYDHLSVKPLTCFVDAHGRTVCNHTCHAECGHAIQKPNRCPICKAAYSALVPVPSVKVDVEAWFRHIDKDNDGALAYQEIIDGLKEQLALDWARVEADVDRLWPSWDHDRNGKVSLEEFANPRTGVVVYLTSHYPMAPRANPPDITKDKAAWFRFWDEDHSQSLDKDEITRALIKTFRLYHITSAVVMEIVNVLWPMFDSDGSGKIDLREFCAPDNLGDTLIAQLMQEARSGGR